jgi:hypothetical protein
MALSKKKKDEIPDSKAQKTTLCRREFLRPPSGGGIRKDCLAQSKRQDYNGAQKI